MGYPFARGVMVGVGDKDRYIGAEALSKWGYVALRFPVCLRAPLSSHTLTSLSPAALRPADTQQGGGRLELDGGFLVRHCHGAPRCYIELTGLFPMVLQASSAT